jgi:hypothetical protein
MTVNRVCRLLRTGGVASRMIQQKCEQLNEKEILTSIIIKKVREILTYHGWNRRGRFKELS